MKKWTWLAGLACLVAGCASTGSKSTSSGVVSLRQENRMMLVSAGVHVVATGANWHLKLYGDSAALWQKSLGYIQSFSTSTGGLAFSQPERIVGVHRKFSMELTDSACTDTLDGVTTGYRVIAMLDTTRLTGCGADVYDLNVNGRWRLIEVNGRALPIGEKIPMLPELEIDAEQHILKGKSACRSVNAKVFVRGTQLHTSQWPADVSTCADIVDALMSAILGDKLTYTVTKQHLLLQNTTGKSLYFTRF